MHVTKKILIIDDDVSTVDILGLIFRNAGYTVICETDGRLLFIENNEMPDLIVLDNALGEADGVEICTYLKKSNFTSRIPIIMISASPEIESVAISAGADAFLPKPFSMQQILTAVEERLAQM